MSRAELKKCIKNVRNLERFYEGYNKKFCNRYPFYRPSEQEVVAYYILPLLFSLGFSKNQIAVQYPTNLNNARNHADIIIYKKDLDKEKDCNKRNINNNRIKEVISGLKGTILTIIEAKNPSILEDKKTHKSEEKSKCIYKEAKKKYVKNGVNCNFMMITDGLRYYAYKIKNGELIAKINLKNDDEKEVFNFFINLHFKP